MTDESVNERIEDSVKICGIKACRDIKALIDSGADRTIISKKIADEVSVQYTGNEVHIEDASGNEIVADEAIVQISIPGTTCRKEKTNVAVPRNSLPGQEIIIGNDFMKETRMQIGYQGGPNITCPKNLGKKR